MTDAAAVVLALPLEPYRSFGKVQRDINSHGIVAEYVQGAVKKLARANVGETMAQLMTVSSIIQLAVAASHDHHCHPRVEKMRSSYETLVQDCRGAIAALQQTSIEIINLYQTALQLVDAGEREVLLARITDKAQTILASTIALVENSSTLVVLSENASESVAMERITTTDDQATHSLTVVAQALGRIKSTFENTRVFWELIIDEVKSVSVSDNIKGMDNFDPSDEQDYLTLNGFKWMAIGHLNLMAMAAMEEAEAWAVGVIYKLPTSENEREMKVVLPIDTAVAVLTARINDVTCFENAARAFVSQLGARIEVDWRVAKTQSTALETLVVKLSNDLSNLTALKTLKQTEIARQTAEIAQLRARNQALQTRMGSLNETIRGLEAEIEDHERRQRNAAIDAIPIVGFFSAIISGDGLRAIPFYSAIDGLISAFSNRLGEARYQLERVHKELDDLATQTHSAEQSIDRTQAELENVQGELTECEGRLTQCNNSRVMAGQQLTAAKNGRRQLQELTSAYDFLNHRVDLVAAVPRPLLIQRFLTDLRGFGSLQT